VGGSELSRVSGRGKAEAVRDGEASEDSKRRGAGEDWSFLSTHSDEVLDRWGVAVLRVIP
jgi:hypothetical protein